MCLRTLWPKKGSASIYYFKSHIYFLKWPIWHPGVCIYTVDNRKHFLWNCNRWLPITGKRKGQVIHIWWQYSNWDRGGRPETIVPLRICHILLIICHITHVILLANKNTRLFIQIGILPQNGITGLSIKVFMRLFIFLVSTGSLSKADFNVKVYTVLDAESYGMFPIYENYSFSDFITKASFDF